MLKIKDLERELKLSRWTLMKLIRQGKIKAVRVSKRAVRIPEEELERIRREGI